MEVLMLKRKLGIFTFLVLFVLGLVITVYAQNNDKPHIDSLDPNQGPVGTEVAIKGSGFGKEKGYGKVTFYKNRNASILSWNDKEIVCKVPKDTKTGNLVVINKEGNKSSGVKFKVLSGILVAPSSLKAENVTEGSVTLKWNKVEKAIAYTLSIGTNTEGTNLKSSININKNTYDMGDLEPNKTYYWKTKALHFSSKKNSKWSRIVSFKTKAEEIKPEPVAETKGEKKIGTSSIIIIAVLVFILLLAIFILVRFLLKRRRLSLEEPELRPEPEESPLPSVSKEETGEPRPDISDIPKPPSTEYRPPSPPEPPRPEPPRPEPPSPEPPERPGV
jgi:hypothetical protein